MSRRNILILDPERDMSELFARALEARKGWKCYWAPREEDACALVKDIPFDLILLDLSAAMAAEFNLLRKLRKQLPKVVIIVDAYLSQKELISKAFTHGANGFVIKPIKVEEFRKKIDAFCAPIDLS